MNYKTKYDVPSTSQNIRESDNDRRFYQIMAYFFTMMLLLLCVIAYFSYEYNNNESHDHSDGIKENTNNLNSEPLVLIESLVASYDEHNTKTNEYESNEGYLSIMFVKDIQSIASEGAKLSKRYYYSNRGYRSNWYRYRWLLWILVIIPVIFLLILFFCCKRRKKRPVQVNPQPHDQYPPPNNQYYQQTQQTGGYYGNDGPGGTNYGGGGYNQGGNYNQGGISSYGNNQSSGAYDNSDFQRPDGPPPAHYKN